VAGSKTAYFSAAFSELLYPLSDQDHGYEGCMNLFMKDNTSLVRESIPYPCMDFQKSTDINMDIHDFWDDSLWLAIQAWISTLISKQGYPCKNILYWISVKNKYPWTFCEYQSSIIHVFMDIHLDILGFLWISMYWLAMDSRSMAKWSSEVRVRA